MATSLNSMRIRLNLEEIICDPNVPSKRFWYLVDSTVVSNIEDLAHDVISKFCLKNYASHIQLLLDGFILPPWEKIEVLRESDEIRFTYYKEHHKLEIKRTKEKKRYNACLKGSKDVTSKSVAKKRKADDHLADDHLSHEHELKSVNKRLKPNNLIKVVSKDASSSSNTDSSSEEDSSTSSTSAEKNINNRSNQFKKSAHNSKQLVVKKNILTSSKIPNPKAGSIKKKQSSSDSSSDSESSNTDSSSDEEPVKNVEKTLKVIAKKSTNNASISSEFEKLKPVSQVTVKNVSSESSSSSTDSNNDNAVKSKQTRKGINVVNTNKRNVLSKKNNNKQPVINESDSDYSSSSDDSSEDNLKETVKVKKNSDSAEIPNSSNKAKDSNDSRNESPTSKITVGAQVGEKKKRKRRGRKRSRPKKKSTEQNMSEQTVENTWRGRYSGYSLVDADDKNIVSVTAVNQNDSPSSNQVQIKNEKELNKSETNGSFFGVKSEVQECSFIQSEGRVKEENYPIQRTLSNGSANSLDLSANLRGGVQVFSRHKKLQKKRSSFPLSEAQALSDMVSHKSFIFEDKGGSGDEMVMKPKVAFNNQDHHKPEPAKPVAPPRDYSSLPDLHGVPRIGDKIAYKILEMSENYCPEVSDYKEGLVKEFNPKDMTVELEILFAKGKTFPGRFDCIVEDEDEILSNTKGEVGSIVTLFWTDLRDTKLVQ